jgi:hypothetical protein
VQAPSPISFIDRDKATREALGQGLLTPKVGCGSDQAIVRSSHQQPMPPEEQTVPFAQGRAKGALAQLYQRQVLLENEAAARLRLAASVIFTRKFCISLISISASGSP